MPRESVKQWLVRANGWQRVWFVYTVICFAYFTVIYPISEANKGRSLRYETKWATEREMDNPLCARYMSEYFIALVDPPYSADGSTCYNIYNYRKFSSENGPITKAVYQDEFNSSERERWGAFIVVGLFAFVLFSASAYGAGIVVAWVVKGFRRGDRDQSLD
jgi:hypothetical protein